MTTFTSGDREEAYKKILEEAPNQPGYEDAVPIPPTEEIKVLEKGLEFFKTLKGDNASPPHIVDSGASVMKDDPVAYINVEERKLEWAKPMIWHTPTIAQMEKIPLYTHPAKTLTDEEIEEVWIQALQDEQKVNAGKFPSLANQPFVFFARAILRKAQEK
jgi:hypothetical protein